ncbi:transcriptional regulator [Paenibacillus dendritiformis]|uniref:DUF1232 domain-containing protein n=1 Tax=Paenibacillus dendritiformis TaxID=130049 RepID=UPI001B0E7B23|nr:DUF1232 domain-containing protein [Paenibacillus dendritiformis]GIO73539.1 transcriptional regulator [Paenibacillus dendritiformis]
MNQADNVPQFGRQLKAWLKERSMSMRKLSEQTGIDTATISRMASGKQAVKPEYIHRIASVLAIPAERLYRAAGYSVGSEPSGRTDMHASVDAIQQVLGHSKLFEPEFSTERVRQELMKCERYARTEEGKRLIHQDFEEKVSKVSGEGPFIEQLRDMFACFCDPAVPEEEKAVLGSALLYFILSVDIIPDYVFPIGYLDDAIAVNMALERLRGMARTPQARSNAPGSDPAAEAPDDGE